MTQCWSKVSIDEYSCRTAHELIIFTTSPSSEKRQKLPFCTLLRRSYLGDSKDSHDILTQIDYEKLQLVISKENMKEISLFFAFPCFSIEVITEYP